MFVLSQWILLFCTCVNIFSTGQARFLTSDQDGAENLKMVLQFYKTERESPTVDSMEFHSVEFGTFNPNQLTAYQIHSPESSTGVTQSSMASSFQEVEVHEGEVVTTDITQLTTSLPQQEETEDETTTLFPGERLEDMSVVPINSFGTEETVPTSTRHSDESIVNLDLDSLPPVNMIVQLEVESESDVNARTSMESERDSNSNKTSITASTIPSTTAITMTNVLEFVSNVFPLSNYTPTTIKTPVSANCSEGDVRRVECNACVCIGGRFLCSQRVCAVPNQSEESNSTVKENPDKVAFNQRSNATELDGIQIGSTPMPFLTITTPKPECYSGKTKSVDCNMCICSPSLKWACTKRACIALTLREKASYSYDQFVNSTQNLVEYADLDEDCTEGEVRSWTCNNCVCFMSSWVCTNQVCPPTPDSVKPKEKETCQTEGQVKSKDCNICRCKRGEWICSNMDCKRVGHVHRVHSKNKKPRPSKH